MQELSVLNWKIAVLVIFIAIICFSIGKRTGKRKRDAILTDPAETKKVETKQSETKTKDVIPKDSKPVENKESK